MKKIIALVLALAVIGVGGWLVWSRVINNPERLIVGEWESIDEIALGDIAGFEGFEFDKEGNVTIKTKLLADVSYDGTYVIDKEAETLTLTYEVFGSSIDEEFTYVFDDDMLTLTSTESDVELEFVKAEK